MKKPLITISIPTFNSDKTLESTLESIRKQSYKNIEINIIDATASKSTLHTAKKYGAKVKVFPGSLLAARWEGIKMSKGKYVLIFDSDQILMKNAIEKAVKLGEKGCDMLVFEEDVYKKDTFIEKLFAADRKLINKINNLDPFTGVIMPRFFKTELLKKAYLNIPKKYFSNTGGPDHAIVYYEASLLSDKIDTIKNAVKHREPSSLTSLLRKFFRWGYTSVSTHYGKYAKLMRQKERFRTGLFTRGLIIESLGSVALLVLKGSAFKLGYFTSLISKKH